MRPYWIMNWILWIISREEPVGRGRRSLDVRLLWICEILVISSHAVQPGIFREITEIVFRVRHHFPR